MFTVQYSNGDYSTRRYQTEGKATAALARRKEIGSAVVWLDDTGKPKVWYGYWTSHGWDQVAPV